jgi:hypothetical protein
MYIGYMEREAGDIVVGEVMYSWSFAISVAGSVSSILAAVIISCSAHYCSPR